jgi:hypothetical protein
MKYYTQPQFEQLLEILIRYKMSCPDKNVYLSEKSLKEASEYFIKCGIFLSQNMDE